MLGVEALHLPRMTVRARLTGLYSLLSILTTGASLLALFIILSRRTDQKSRATADMLAGAGEPNLDGLHVIRISRPGDLAAARTAELHQLLFSLSLIFGALLLVAAVGGWVMAGRVLRPVHQISMAARKLSSENLAGRIAQTGPADELKDLADTFDAFLDRLQAAVESQRLFVANASHELRTPLSIQRTMLEVALVDPSPDELSRARSDLLAVNQRSEQMIDALLLLAQSESGPRDTDEVQLDVVVAEVVCEQQQVAADLGVRVELRTAPVVVLGNVVLLHHLVENLVRNASVYNHPGGAVTVSVKDSQLSVVNTGPVVPPDRVEGLFEPFNRLEPAANGSNGLGLAIVRSIVRAHHGQIRAQANPDGGLTIVVCLPHFRDTNPNQP